MSRYRGGPTTTLYIRNISDRVRYEDLKRLFQKYGKLVDVTIPLDYFSGMPKGYCFVEYEDPRDSEEAQYRMDRQRLFGREIEVEFARGDRKSSGEMKTRDRERVPRYPRGGAGPYDRRMEEYERYERPERRMRSRSRSIGRERERERRGGGGERRSRSKSREPSVSRKKPRALRSYSKNKTPSPSPRNPRSESRERSKSHERSVSRSRGSPRESPRGSPRGSPRRHESRSPKESNNISRSPSPA